MMFGKISKQDAIHSMKVAVDNITGVYLHGWAKERDLQFSVIMRCLAEAVEKIGGYDALVEVFGPEKEKKVEIDFKEIIKLNDLLDKAEIPHDWVNIDNPEAGVTGRRIIYPSIDAMFETKECADAVVSYSLPDDGADDAFNMLSVGAPLLEVCSCLRTDEGERRSFSGGQTAEEVFDKWAAHYDSKPEA